LEGAGSLLDYHAASVMAHWLSRSPDEIVLRLNDTNKFEDVEPYMSTRGDFVVARDVNDAWRWGLTAPQEPF
jgi:hypothetical protein